MSTETTPECDAINPETCACTAAVRAARAAGTTPAIERACASFYNDPAGLTSWRRLSESDPTLADKYRAGMRNALAAALDGDDGGDAHTEAIHDVVCDGRSMEDCDGLCGEAFDALRASILGGAR